MKNSKFSTSSISLPIIFFIIGILVINILSLGFISILGLPASVQLAYSSEGEAEGNDFEKEESEENGDDDSNYKSSPKVKSPLSLPLANDDSQDEEEAQEQEDSTDGDSGPSAPSEEKREAPASLQNPRLVPQATPLAAGSDDNSMPTSSSSSIPSSSPISTEQLLPLQILNLCSDAIDCATLRILTNYYYNITSNTSKDIPTNNIMAVNIERNNQSISSFTLNNNETTSTNLLIDPGQYDIIANITDGSTTIGNMSADCSGSLKAGETKTCTIII